MDIVDFLFPKTCLECGKGNHYLCNKCLFKVPYANTICPVCERFSFFGATHEKCRRDNCLDGIINLWMYRGVIRKTIIKLKYKFAFDIAKELGLLAEIELRKFKTKDTNTIVPIPLYKTRNNWRGFNQTEMLAKEISTIKGWRVLPLLENSKKTDPQVTLSRVERYYNEHLFVCNKKIDTLDKSKRIFVFDDVWTTGSTIRGACDTLKRNGFKSVWGLTIARS
jgi:ComF family protein